METEDLLLRKRFGQVANSDKANPRATEDFAFLSRDNISKY